jgi:hypothetical protein
MTESEPKSTPLELKEDVSMDTEMDPIDLKVMLGVCDESVAGKDFQFTNLIKEESERDKKVPMFKEKKIEIPEKIPCLSCSYQVDSGWQYCPKCGSSVILPGQTVDLSQKGINFGLSNQLGMRWKPQYTTSDHDLPCPPQSHPDISKDQAINAWVFNHLPMSEEQKEKMLQEFRQDTSKDLKKNFKEERDRTAKEKKEEVKAFREIDRAAKYHFGESNKHRTSKPMELPVCARQSVKHQPRFKLVEPGSKSKEALEKHRQRKTSLNQKSE